MRYLPHDRGCRYGSRCLLLVALLFGHGGCRDATPAAPPVPQVEILVARPQALENVIEAPGRVQAVGIAQVRARVDGIVQQRSYVEGSDVVAGQELFRIDPRELSARVSAARASLARARATAANAAQDVERYQGLVADQAISKQEYDAAVARLRTARADVLQASAELESARLNLGYTRVTAPIAGRAGRAEVTAGALVSASAGTLLTTIEQLDPINVNFSQSSADLLRIRQEIARGALQVPVLGRVAVSLILEDGSHYSHTGHLNFLDLSIDEATGTAAVRAEFPNPQRMLLPGQFVRARIDAGVRPNVFLIPQRAVRVSAASVSVMLVGKNSTVSARDIRVGELRGGAWVVQSGLRAGDRVIVDGWQKVRPGSRVRIAGQVSRPETPAAKRTAVPTAARVEQ